VDAGDVKVGLWGLLAALETDTRLPTGTPGGENDFVSYCIGTDVVLQLTERFSVRGEAYFGQALSDLRGGIGQSINAVAGDEIRTYGGWVELGFHASEVIRFVGVAAIDNPLNRDLSSGAAQRSRNLAYGLACAQQWTGAFKTGLEALYWSTKWVDEGLGTMLRFNFYTQLNF
jgi:hypothetical protein